MPDQENHKIYKIMVVDDEKWNRQIMANFLTDYECVTAEDGADALEKLKHFQPDLVFLDLMMPGVNGFEVCSALKADAKTERIPVVIVTSLDDRESRIRGLKTGANDFLIKPLDRIELLVRTQNLLKMKEYEDLLADYNRNLAEQLDIRTQELQQAFLDTIHRLTLVAEYKDEETASHIRRTGHYTSLMGKVFGFDDQKCKVLYYGAPMHDVGKIGIPDNILLKPGRLTPEEFEIMKSHTEIGQHILQNASSEILRCAEMIAGSHHERFDGSGYPKKLKGAEIPLEGRMFNLIDQYDALRSKRPYKPALSHDEVYRILTEGDGRTMPCHFDPDVLDAFRQEHLRFRNIFDENQE